MIGISSYHRASVLVILLLAASLRAQDVPLPGPSNWSQTRFGEVGWLDSGDPDEAGILTVAVSHAGKMLATGHADGLVRLWNPRTGVELFVLRGHRDAVCALAFSDADRTLVSVSAREIIRWNTSSGTQQKSIALAAGSLEQAVLTPNAQTLVMATRAGGVTLFRGTTGVETGQLERPTRPVLALAGSLDGKTLAIGEEGGGVSLWNLENRRSEAELAAAEPYLPRAVAFSPDGRLMAAALGRDGVTVWDRTTRARRAHLRTAPRTVCALTFAPDGRGVLLGTTSGQVLCFDLGTGQQGAAVRSHAGQIQQMLLLPGQRLMTSGTDTVLRLWRVYPPGESVAPEVEPKLSTREVTIVLDDLRATAPEPADRAARTLLLLPQQAVALLRQQIKPVASADPKRFAALLDDLSSRRFQAREKAFVEIQKMGESARGLILQSLAAPLDLETHNRLRLLDQRLEKPDASAAMRLALRGIHVLARINSPEARRLLEELAGGVPGTHLTRAAQSALGRGR